MDVLRRPITLTLTTLFALTQLACTHSPKLPDQSPIEHVSFRADDPNAQRSFDQAVVLLRRGQYQESVDALKIVQAEHPEDNISPVAELYIARANLGKIEVDPKGKWTSSATAEQLAFAERSLAVLAQADGLDSRLRWATTVYQGVALTLLGKASAAIALLKGYPGATLSDVILPEDRLASWLLVSQALLKDPGDRALEAMVALGQVYESRVTVIPMPTLEAANASPEPAQPSAERVLPEPDKDAVLTMALAKGFEIAQAKLSTEELQQQCLASKSPFVVALGGWTYLKAQAKGKPDEQARQRLENVATRTSSALARLGALNQVAELSAMMATLGDERKLIVGALLPLSGPNKAVGQRVMRGLMLAQGAFSQAATPRLTLVFEDSEGDPVSRFEALKAYQPLAIIGPIERERAQTYGELANKAKLPMITLSAKALDAPASQDAERYVFRHFIDAEAEAMAIASLSFNQLKDRRVAILYPQMPYGQSMSKYFAARFEALGGQVVLQESYDRSKNDYSALARKVAAKELDAIFVPDSPQKVAQLSAFLAREDVWGVAPQVNPQHKPRRLVHYLGTSLWQERFLIDQASSYVQGAMIPAWYSAAIQTPLVKDFVSRHQGVFAAEASIYEAFAYDAMSWLRQLTLDAGIRRPGSIREALLRPEGFEGVTGQAIFLSSGEPERRLRFVRVDGQGFAPTPWIERVNHAADAAPAQEQPPKTLP